MFASVKKIAHKQILGSECNSDGHTEAQCDEVAFASRAISMIVLTNLVNKCGVRVKLFFKIIGMYHLKFRMLNSTLMYGFQH